MTTQQDCVAIVGSGAMGRGIAQLAAAAGHRTRLVDARPGAASEAAVAIAAQFARLAEKGRMTADAASDASARLIPCALKDLDDADLVVEAIVENLEIKQALFKELEGVASDGAILATNTSSLSVTAIAAVCRLPGRIAGFHFFNPVPLMKLVEVIPGLRTAQPTIDRLLALGRAWGHTAVLAQDSPGFLVNHAGRAYGTEALRLLVDGVGDVASLDRCLRDQAGFRMGPFELLDLTALDVSIPVMESIHAQYYGEPRYRPSAYGRLRLTAGLLGRKTGEGFYRYEKDQAQVPPEPAPGLRPERAVWVQPGRAPADALSALLRAGGVRLAAAPGDGALNVLMPEAMDCTDAALAESLDPAETVAVDGFFGFERRIVAMTNPATSAETKADAHALLAAAGKPVTFLRDSLGFAAPRVVASVVNLACAIAQQGVASPDDINRAVQLGLGYPQGPLTWGDKLGAGRILALLQALLAATGDPRYRPSEWLARRAKLGLSLTALEI